MARIRTIKPDFFASPKSARVTRDARLFFAGLLTEADDEGRLLGSSKRLAGCLFPYDDDVTNELVETWIVELENAGLIQTYDVHTTRYIFVIGFTEHQRVSHPTESKHPAPPTKRSRKIPEDPRSPHENFGGEGKGKERKGKEQSPVPSSQVVADPHATNISPPQAAARQVFDTWIKAAGKTGATKYDTKRRRLITNALKDYPLEDVLDAVQGWRNSPHHRGENDRAMTYNDLELLLRDAAHIEKFRDLNREPKTLEAKRPGFKPLTDEEIAQLEGRTA